MIGRALVIAALAGLFSTLPSPAAAQTGWGVGVLKNGDVYFCDRTRDRVWKLTPDGQLTLALEDTHCHALVAGPDDAIYGESVGSAVAASAELGVWRIAPSGARRWLQPPSLSPDPSIWVITDRRDRMYSWNGAEGGRVSRIIRRDSDGAIITLAGGAWGIRDGIGENARFGHVGGVAIARDGTLVVADSGNIRRVDSAGTVQTEAVGVLTGTTGGSPRRAGLWDYDMGVATDTDGSTVVLDAAARRIIKVARDGRAVELWHAGGLANAITRRAWGWQPTGFAMLGSSFYVVESLPVPPLLADLVGSPRLLHVQRDGTTTRIVSVSSLVVRAAAALVVLTILSWATTARRRRRRSGVAWHHPVPPRA